MPTTREAQREAELLAADAIGDVIEHWGFRKALGRVWAVLYIAGEPLPAAELSERLQMSSGATSTALTELQRWGVVRRVWRPGERREFFDAETDFWKMISRVVHDRERFLARSVHERLEHPTEVLRAAAPQSPETREAATRIKRLMALSSVAMTVIDSFIASQTADFSGFGDLLRLVRPAAKGRGGAGR
jgi:DNA-binding transcriptional regulator GbsR (MarR family)